MIPASYNLPTGYRGDSYGPIVFKFLDTSGEAIILDGSTGHMQVKEGIGMPTVLFWSTVDSSMTINGNEVTLSLKPGDYTLVQPKNYVYDLQLTSGDVTKTYVKGFLPFINDVTHI